MKKVFMPLAIAMTVVSLTACGGNNADSTTDSLSTTTTTSESASATEGSGTSTNQSSSASIDVSRSYVDLSSGSNVKLERDTETGYYINTQTRKPVNFYFNPETHDTFDMRGRVVNLALIRDDQGSYTIDEDKVKMQSDGDLKIKDDETDTKVKLEEDGDTKLKTNGAKEKTDDGRYKYKDDSTKVKVNADGKVKVKGSK